MKIYQNVLKKDTLLTIQTDLIQKKIKDNLWKSSLFCWDNNLTENGFGSCLCSQIIDKNITNLLENELKLFFNNEYKSLLFYYYIWQPFSHINVHDDHIYSFGATLYLHDICINDGGIFLWKDDKSEKYSWNAVCAEENMLIVNENKQKHAVTMVNPKSQNYRFTIQIWGLK